MPKIKHIGITTNDPGATADFFINAFGLVEVSRNPEYDSVVLSDGYINVTILKFQYDRYGGGYPGLHHFGFQVEDLAEIEKLAETKAVDNSAVAVGESLIKDPEGYRVDLSVEGWPI